MYITAVYAAISALLVVALSFRVIRLRLSTRTGIGDGGHQDLARCIRAHANAVEYLPLALLLLLLVQGTSVAIAPMTRIVGGLLAATSLATVACTAMISLASVPA